MLTEKKEPRAFVGVYSDIFFPVFDYYFSMAYSLSFVEEYNFLLFLQTSKKEQTI